MPWMSQPARVGPQRARRESPTAGALGRSFPNKARAWWIRTAGSLSAPRSAKHTAASPRHARQPASLSGRDPPTASLLPRGLVRLQRQAGAVGFLSWSRCSRYVRVRDVTGRHSLTAYTVVAMRCVARPGKLWSLPQASIPKAEVGHAAGCCNAWQLPIQDAWRSR